MDPEPVKKLWEKIIHDAGFETQTTLDQDKVAAKYSVQLHPSGEHSNKFVDEIIAELKKLRTDSNITKIYSIVGFDVTIAITFVHFYLIK